MSVWQPIETAPTDGSHVLVYAPPYTNHGILGPVNHAEQFAVTTHEEGGWFEDSSEMYPVHEPTHWMPLPDKPQVAEGRRRDRDGADAKSNKPNGGQA